MWAEAGVYTFLSCFRTCNVGMHFLHGFAPRQARAIIVLLGMFLHGGSMWKLCAMTGMTSTCLFANSCLKEVQMVHRGGGDVSQASERNLPPLLPYRFARRRKGITCYMHDCAPAGTGLVAGMAHDGSTSMLVHCWCLALVCRHVLPARPFRFRGC